MLDTSQAATKEKKNYDTSEALDTSKYNLKPISKEIKAFTNHYHFETYNFI